MTEQQIDNLITFVRLLRTTSVKQCYGSMGNLDGHRCATGLGLSAFGFELYNPTVWSKDPNLLVAYRKDIDAFAELLGLGNETILKIQEKNDLKYSFSEIADYLVGFLPPESQALCVDDKEYAVA